MCLSSLEITVEELSGQKGRLLSLIERPAILVDRAYVIKGGKSDVIVRYGKGKKQYVWVEFCLTPTFSISWTVPYSMSRDIVFPHSNDPSNRFFGGMCEWLGISSEDLSAAIQKQSS